MTSSMQHRTDEQLKNAIEEELLWIPTVNSTHIGVAVDDGTVTLSGHVDSSTERLLAGQAAFQVSGVKSMAQDITVGGVFETETDADIAHGAGELLAHAAGVPDTVRVSVTDHEITLTGEVERMDQSEAAGRAMHHITGNPGVVNEIRVISPAAGRPALSTISQHLTPKDNTMGQYEQRLVIVEEALKAEQVHPAKGRTLAEAAVTVLAAIDEIKESMR